MARLFDDGASECLQIESAVVSAYPLGMACWFNSNDDTTNQMLIWVGDKDVDTHYTGISARGAVGGDPVRAISRDYGGANNQVADTSSGFASGTWHHAAGMFLSVSERHVYIDGGNKGSDTDTVGAMANHDRTTIGCSNSSIPGNYMSGDIAEAAIWDLTSWGANDAARELAFEKAIASMAKGYSPLFFPLGRLGCWKLIRDLNDISGGYNLTASGTVVSAHPRVIYPSKLWVPRGIAVGTPSASPSASISASPSASISASPSVTPSASISASPSASISTSISASPSASISASPSATPSASISASPSATPSASISASISASPSTSVSASPSASPSAGVSTANIHIFSSTGIEPNHATDNSGSVLVQDGLEVQGNAWFGGATNHSKFEADSTLVFKGAATVFNDLVLPLDSAKVPASNAPNWESFVGNLNAFAYQVNDFQEFTTEMIHGYKEGSDFAFHIHGALNALTAQEEKVRFEIEYSIADANQLTGFGDVFPDGSGSLLIAELVVPDATADLTHIFIVVGVDNAGTFAIDATIKGRIRRIAKSAGGNELTGNIFLTQVGLHYEIDTVGSRTISTK